MSGLVSDVTNGKLRMTPAADTTILGKRKQPEKPLNVTFDLRVVLENMVATDPVTISASEFKSMADILAETRRRVPLARRQSILGENLCAPLFLVQETGETTKALRERRFTTFTYNCIRDSNAGTTGM